jgi:hypothetical protein
MWYQDAKASGRLLFTFPFALLVSGLVAAAQLLRKEELAPLAWFNVLSFFVPLLLGMT